MMFHSIFRIKSIPSESLPPLVQWKKRCVNEITILLIFWHCWGDVKRKWLTVEIYENINSSYAAKTDLMFPEDLFLNLLSFRWCRGTECVLLKYATDSIFDLLRKSFYSPIFVIEFTCQRNKTDQLLLTTIFLLIVVCLCFHLVYGRCAVSFSCFGEPNKNICIQSTDPQSSAAQRYCCASWEPTRSSWRVQNRQKVHWTMNKVLLA